MRDTPEERLRRLRIDLTLTAAEADTFAPKEWLEQLASAAEKSPSVTVDSLSGSHNNPLRTPSRWPRSSSGPSPASRRPPDRGPEPGLMRVLVTGASRYLGSRIVPELLRRGHDFVASGTGETPPDAPWVEQAEWQQVDVFDLRVLVGALEEVDAVVYLIHGLGDADFSRMDRRPRRT